jgi:8-oxo-dGTP pyrophosphatase MutT (NUDIX family)
MEELSVLVTRRPNGNIEFCGCAQAYATHVHGMPHTTVQLVPVTWDLDRQEPVVLLHKRSPHKRTSPDAWDFCGGHLTFDESYFDGRPWQSAYDLGRAAVDGAVREANEEIHCDPSFQFTQAHIYQFQTVGYFDCRAPTAHGLNVEFSTAYVVMIPPDRRVGIWDTDMLGERELECRRLGCSELFNCFQESQQPFADGADRILRKLIEDEELKSEFLTLVTQIARQSKDLKGG